MENVMTIRVLIFGLVITLGCNSVFGQGSSSVILAVDVENLVNYVGDVAEPSRFATNPNVTPAAVPKNFHGVAVLGDIVAVNGQPSKGVFAFVSRVLQLTRTPNPGQAIADVVRTNANDQTFEILTSD